MIRKVFFLTFFSFWFLFFTSPIKAEEKISFQRFLVKYLPSVSSSERIKIHRLLKLEEKGRIEKLGVEIISVEEDRFQEIVSSSFFRGKTVYIEPDYLAYTTEYSNDPALLKNFQWGLLKIEVAKEGKSAWNFSHSLSSIKVAVIDTGIDTNHEDLRGKIVENKNCTDSQTYNDFYGHGTHVAGIIGASTNNGLGIAGTGYEVSLLNAKALGDEGFGYYSWIADCLVWAVDQGAKIVNMSFGGSSRSRTLEAAINYATEKGVLLVASAGNSNRSLPFYPAAYSQVLSVGATDEEDRKASFSNYGRWVKLVAPGVSIYSTLPQGKNKIGQENYGFLSGTSMSAPYVSGVAALLLGKKPLKRNEIVFYLTTYSDKIPGTGRYWVYGRVNALSALEALVSTPSSLKKNY